jgi:hypothetical protein
MHSNAFGDDHWLLQGLVIEINGREWYSNDGIKVWLGNDDVLPSEFSEVLHQP